MIIGKHCFCVAGSDAASLNIKYEYRYYKYWLFNEVTKTYRSMPQMVSVSKAITIKQTSYCVAIRIKSHKVYPRKSKCNATSRVQDFILFKLKIVCTICFVYKNIRAVNISHLPTPQSPRKERFSISK